jgi:hypothetical protein
MAAQREATAAQAFSFDALGERTPR